MVDKAQETLGDYIKKQEKKQKDSRSDELIKKAGLKVDESLEIEEEAESIETMRAKISSEFNFFIDLILLITNPFLVKNGITPFQDEELRELKDAIIPLINPTTMVSMEKVAGAVEGISGLKKIYDVFKALWRILRPRFSQLKKFFKSKKEEGEIDAG